MVAVLADEYKAAHNGLQMPLFNQNGLLFHCTTTCRMASYGPYAAAVTGWPLLKTKQDFTVTITGEN